MCFLFFYSHTTLHLPPPPQLPPSRTTTVISDTNTSTTTYTDTTSTDMTLSPTTYTTIIFTKVSVQTCIRSHNLLITSPMSCPLGPVASFISQCFVPYHRVVLNPFSAFNLEHRTYDVAFVKVLSLCLHDVIIDVSRQESDSSAHLGKRTKQHRLSSNSRFDLHNPKKLYRCFRKQHGHVLCLHCSGTWTTRGPV